MRHCKTYQCLISLCRRYFTRTALVKSFFQYMIWKPIFQNNMCTMRAKETKVQMKSVLCWIIILTLKIQLMTSTLYNFEMGHRAKIRITELCVSCWISGTGVIFRRLFITFMSVDTLFSPRDRDFGSIKRLLRKMVKTPDGFDELMLKTRVSGRFTVYKFTTGDVLSCRSWWPHLYRKTTNSDETSGRGVPREPEEQFKVPEYRHFKYSNKTQGKVVVMKFIQVFPSTFRLLKTSGPPELPSEKTYAMGKVS